MVNIFLAKTPAPGPKPKRKGLPAVTTIRDGICGSDDRSAQQRPHCGGMIEVLGGHTEVVPGTVKALVALPIAGIGMVTVQKSEFVFWSARELICLRMNESAVGES